MECDFQAHLLMHALHDLAGIVAQPEVLLDETLQADVFQEPIPHSSPVSGQDFGCFREFSEGQAKNYHNY